MFLLDFFIFSFIIIFGGILFTFCAFLEERGVGLAVRIDRFFSFFHQSTKLPVRVVLLELCKLTISPPLRE